MLLLKVFYIALFAALFYFGPLQEYLHTKKSEWDLKGRRSELKTDEASGPIDPEKMGSLLSLVLILLASAFFLWKILTTTFSPA